jgi:hypothetical protein
LDARIYSVHRSSDVSQNFPASATEGRNKETIRKGRNCHSHGLPSPEVVLTPAGFAPNGANDAAALAGVTGREVYQDPAGATTPADTGAWPGITTG